MGIYLPIGRVSGPRVTSLVFVFRLWWWAREKKKVEMARRGVDCARAETTGVRIFSWIKGMLGRHKYEEREWVSPLKIAPISPTARRLVDEMKGYGDYGLWTLAIGYSRELGWWWLVGEVPHRRSRPSSWSDMTKSPVTPNAATSDLAPIISPSCRLFPAIQNSLTPSIDRPSLPRSSQHWLIPSIYSFRFILR